MHITKILRIILFVLLIAGCGREGTKQSKEKQIFRYNEISGISSLDPAAASTFENIGTINLIYNGLVEMDDSLNVTPSIAKRWIISPDGKQYTFYLRTDVKFHSSAAFKDSIGRKVTANDFVFSFNRLNNLKTSAGSSLLRNIDTTSHSGFYAVNDSVLKIYLQKPFAPFLGILTMKFFSVVPHEAVELYREDFRSHPVGTGPFKYKVWEESTRLILTKNENYFETDGREMLPYLDAVSISFIKDKETAFLEFLKGNIDMISGMDAINKDEVFTTTGELKDNYSDKIVLQTQAFLKTDYLGFLVDDKNEIVKNSPSAKKEVRQAINYAIDRVRLIRYLRNNIGTPAVHGFVPPGLPSFDTSLVGYSYNPERARELLKKAGYNNDNMPEITLSTTEQYLDICEYVQSQLSEVGIKLKINIEKASVLSQAVANGQIGFFRKSWVCDYPDAENFFSVFYSENHAPDGFNTTHFSNKRFDELYEKSKIETDENIRFKMYKEMDAILIAESPVVPLYYDKVVRLVQKNISGLTSNPMNLLNLKRVKKANK